MLIHEVFEFFHGLLFFLLVLFELGYECILLHLHLLGHVHVLLNEIIMHLSFPRIVILRNLTSLAVVNLLLLLRFLLLVPEHHRPLLHKHLVHLHVAVVFHPLHHYIVLEICDALILLLEKTLNLLRPLLLLNFLLFVSFLILCNVDHFLLLDVRPLLMLHFILLAYFLYFFCFAIDLQLILLRLIHLTLQKPHPIPQNREVPLNLPSHIPNLAH